MAVFKLENVTSKHPRSQISLTLTVPRRTMVLLNDLLTFFKRKGRIKKGGGELWERKPPFLPSEFALYYPTPSL